MRNTELYFAQKYCWDHNIFVVVKLTSKSGKYRIAISRNGREKLGEEIYENHSHMRLVELQSPTGQKTKHKVVVPAVHDKIESIYIDIFRKNGGMETVEYKINQEKLIKELCKEIDKDWSHGADLTRKALFTIYESSVEFFQICSSYPKGSFKDTIIKVWEKLPAKNVVKQVIEPNPEPKIQFQKIPGYPGFLKAVLT